MRVKWLCQSQKVVLEPHPPHIQAQAFLEGVAQITRLYQGKQNE